MNKNRKNLLALSLFSVLFLCSAVASAKDKTEKIVAQLKNGSLSATVFITGPSLPFDTLFYLSVKTTSEDMGYELVNFDAIMSAHGHGMMVKPKITKLNQREWRIDGVKLHMRGDWKFIFEWVEKGKKTKSTYDIVI